MRAHILYTTRLAFAAVALISTGCRVAPHTIDAPPQLELSPTQHTGPAPYTGPAPLGWTNLSAELMRHHGALRYELEGCIRQRCDHRDSNLIPTLLGERESAMALIEDSRYEEAIRAIHAIRSDLAKHRGATIPPLSIDSRDTDQNKTREPSLREVEMMCVVYLCDLTHPEQHDVAMAHKRDAERARAEGHKERAERSADLAKLKLGQIMSAQPAGFDAFPAYINASSKRQRAHDRLNILAMILGPMTCAPSESRMCTTALEEDAKARARLERGAMLYANAMWEAAALEYEAANLLFDKALTAMPPRK